MRRSILTIPLLTITLQAGAGEMNQSVAASLKEVINELSSSYSAKNPGSVLCMVQ